MITFTHKGDLAKTAQFLRRAKNLHFEDLQKYGEAGVRALMAATPVDTGLTASSWYYQIREDSSGVSIEWLNSNVKRGIVIAILIQNGHASKSGNWVPGHDYINPAIQPIFDEISKTKWREVIKF